MADTNPLYGVLCIALGSLALHDQEDALKIAAMAREVLASRPAEVDDWISVEDRLPPKYEEVIVWPHPTDYCMTAELYGENASGRPLWKYGQYVHGHGHEDIEITWGPISHWKPMPVAPSHTTNKEK